MTDTEAVPLYRTPKALHYECLCAVSTVAEGMKMAYRRGHRDALTGSTADLVGDVGTLPWYDGVVLRWLQEHWTEATGLISAEPYWDDLEGVDEVEITYRCDEGPRLARVTGERLADLKSLIEYADMPAGY